MIAAKAILILFTSLTATLGNTLLKTGASAGGEGELLEIRNLPRTLFKPAIIGGGLIYLVSMILWITVLRVIDLSLAYPMQIGLNFIFIMLIARVYFRETLSWGKLVGVVFIFAGIVLSATA